MASLMELVERVNKGELIESAQLEVYQESPNSAEKFLAHHAHAMLDLRRAQQHMMQSLEAIEYSDQKVLNQFMSVSGFLDLTDLRAGPVVKFGACAIGRREYALGLEAIQNGVGYDLAHGGAWTSDRENCQFVATQYDRAAQCIGWAPPQVPLAWNNKQTRLAIIVSSVADEEAAGKFIRGLARYHDAKRFKLAIYSTEAGARRDKQLFGQTTYVSASSKRGAQTIAELSKQKISVWTAPTDGDCVTAANALAAQLVKDKVDVALIDATQADPIAALIATWDVAPVKVNLARRSPLYATNLNCITYLDPVRFEADREYWQRRGVETKYILEGMDIDAPLGPAPARAQYGIPDSAVVLATAGQDLDKSMSPEFVDTIINILRAHPHAIYLLIGDGELAWQKRKFEAAGVSKRVGYAGKRKDLPSFLRIADLYLSEFPAGSAQGALMAMSVERPVVAMKCGDDAEHGQAATLVGAEGSIPTRDASAYIERVSKIIRDARYRAQLGKSMRGRVEQHFGFGQTARQIEQMCDQLLQRQTEAAAPPPPEGSAHDFRTVATQGGSPSSSSSSSVAQVA
jgi:predicted O-linked N-acetylglucosamine transferase (SPINDLY family)